MNRYPLWKYLLLIFTLGFGILYALPNIYPPDPAVQVTGQSVALKVDDALLKKATQALDAANIPYKSVEKTETNGLVRLKSQDDQLLAQSKIAAALGDDYIVAVNLAQTTPEWLLGLGAGPMKLGLDLAGGVHFLLEVDTPRVLTEEVASIKQSLERTLRQEKIRGVRIAIEKFTLMVSAPSDDIRMKITEILRKNYPEVGYEKSDLEQGNFLLKVSLKESYIKEKEDYAVKQNLTTLRNRVNEIGVAEPLVQRQGRNRIVVELPGIQDTSMAKKIIGKTASLEFRLEANASTLSSQREAFAWKNEQDQARRGNAELVRRPIVTGENVTNAQVGYDQDTGMPQVNITLDGQGGNSMNRKTRTEVGRKMGVLFIEYKTVTRRSVDESGEETVTYTQVPEKRVINLATIQSALGKSFRITGLDSPQEASELALLLRAGALAAPMGFVEERTIGPSLGAENVEKGLISVQAGLLFVLVFMLVYYKVFGIAANIALSLNLVLLIAIMSIFGATLTLPGIAGIVLTVGMAVDANVLIFSRIREEVKAGAPPQKAIHSGYEQAFSTILDANITTFIVAIILYAIGSGPVKGFAVTLAIGIVTSMFTAILGSRAIVNLIYGGRNVKKLWV